jgi:hypothetical protein
VSNEFDLKYNIREEVLQYLRGQTQLVIGYAVMIGDNKKFLRSNEIEP